MQTAALAQPRPRQTERRRHNRMKVALLGRYMLSDRREYACQTIDMSPGGISLVAPVKGTVGERIVLYLEHIGRVEGEITRQTAHGFAVSISATTRKRDKLASQLTWLGNRHELGLPEDRRHERIVPRNPVCELKLESGRVLVVRLIDISMSGAAVSIEDKDKLAIGTSVTLGRTPGKVVRHFQGGMAVEFLLSLSPDRFDDNLVL
jgi:c-di-GMP-binding flagellar brake protein YcgR